MSQSHHNHHNHRIPVSFESKQPFESFEIIKVEVQIHQSLSLAPGPSWPQVPARWSPRIWCLPPSAQSLQRWSPTNWPRHPSRWSYHRRHRSWPQKGHGTPWRAERIGTEHSAAAAAAAARPQVLCFSAPRPSHWTRRTSAPKGPTGPTGPTCFRSPGYHWIPLDSYEATATSEILRSPDSFSALMASSTAAWAFWACQNITRSRFRAKQPASHCIIICSLEVEFQEMVLSSVKVRWGLLSQLGINEEPLKLEEKHTASNC